VYVLFGNGVAAAYDLSGHRRWARVVDRPSSGWGHSASPLLIGNKLVVHVRRLIALDAATGSNVWQAAGDPRWGSPVLARIGSQEVCVTPGGDVVNVSDGAVLARKVSNLDFCTPLVREGIAYFVQHGGRAIRLPEPSGPESMPETLWTTKPENDRYYASPVLRDGVLYATTQKGHLSLIDAATGEVLCSKDLKLGGTAYPSIVSAGPYVYVSSDSGCTVLLKPGRQIEVFATNRLEPFRSSMLFAGTRLYVRGLQHMYCIGNPSP
jgi:outer membrane protein assembly factor BamB